MPHLDQHHVVPANVEQLSTVFDLLDAAADGLALPEERRGIVALVVEEAFVNLCRHAYRGRADGAVKVWLSGSVGELAVELRDTGAAFNPIEQAPKPRLDASIEERRPGGLGVELMRRMTDALRYCRDDSENVLTLVFRWPAG
jgi:anti-sigma regulatory factor (Ser/Thr protein kinase)